MARGIKRRAETGIKPGLAILRQDAGIELRLVPFAAAEEVAVPVVYMAVEFVFACRLITDRDGDGVFLIQDIIKVISPVRAAGNIWRVQTGPAEGIARIIGLFVDDAFIALVGQVIHGRRPADIIVQAENMSVEPVM